MAEAAGVPKIISYQGRLADSNGDLLGGSGTTYYFKFSIWNNATVGSGTKLWPSGTTGTTTATVKQGVFNVNIGDTSAGYPDSLETFDFNSARDIYLQVEVSSDNNTIQTLSPRQRIAATTFANLAGAVSGSSTPSSFGTTTPFGTSVVSIEATSTSAIALSLRAILSQIANLFQVQDSTGSNLFFINSVGGVFASSTFQATGATRLYSTLNVGGLTTLGQASSTIFSNVGLAYFGGTATSTFNSAGGLTLAGVGQGWMFSDGVNPLAASTSPTVNYVVATSTTASQFWGGLIAFASSTFQNFTGLNSTTTNATSTTFATTILCLTGDTCRTSWPTSGGSGGGTWSTTTSQVSGTLINYSNNDTDVVAIGSNASTTAEYYFDPSTYALFRNALIINNATSTIRNLDMVNSTSTNATSTRLFATNLQATNGSIASLITTSATTTSATTTNLAVTSIASSLITTNSTGVASAYAGASCTNQFIRSLNGAGASTCATVSLTADVTGDLPFANLAQVAANSVLANITGSTGDAASIATSSLFAGTDGQILARSGGTWTGVATTTFSTGLTFATGNTTCDTASASVFGCLTSASFSKFNSATTTFSTGVTFASGAVTLDTASASVFGGLTPAFFSKFNSATTTFSTGVTFASGAVTLDTASASVFGGLTPAFFSKFNSATSTLSTITGSLALTQLAAQAANTVLVNNTGSSASPVAIATSSLFAGTDGQILARSGGTWTGVATTTFSTGLTFATGNTTCDTASASVFGCLTSASFSKFNSATTTFSTGVTYSAGAVTLDTASASVFGGLTPAFFSKFNSATTTFSTGVTFASGAVTLDTASASVFGGLTSAFFSKFNSATSTLSTITGTLAVGSGGTGQTAFA